MLYLSWGLWTPGLALAIAEMVRRPRRLICDCPSARWHLKPRWLFLIGACYIASDVAKVAIGSPYPFTAAVGGIYLWRWWRHGRNGKRLKDKILGVVRATAAGLKVVPVGGAR
jgi:hypothetical protein